MSTLEERYEGEFLEAIDLPEGALVSVTIEAVIQPDVEKDAGGKLIRKAILKFKDKKKRMVLNKTNYRMLKTVLGADSAKWIGKAVSIQRRYLDAKHAFGQHNEMCVRVIPAQGTPIPKSAREFLGSRTPLANDC